MDAGKARGGMMQQTRPPFAIDWQAVLLWLAIAPLFVLGWLAGMIVTIALWVWAALVAGYQAGRYS